jgi:Dolichyl-phosphate-mannose-protein mannosyltransferase
VLCFRAPAKNISGGAADVAEAADSLAGTDSLASPGDSGWRGLVPVLLLALFVFLVHLATNSRYGFHRDELQVLDDARHLGWGFVPYPPFTPFVEWASLHLFGVSLVGLRLISAFTQAVALVLTGLTARELGGGRLAQITAALAVAVSPLPLFEGTEFQYSSFDYLWWVAIAWCMVRLLNSQNPRWWLAVGAFVGLGFMTKYTMLFLVTSIFVGVVLTPLRRDLRSVWFWSGAALALVIFLPNLLWQYQHHFVSLEFLRHIHARDVAEGRADTFIRDQFYICTSTATVPLWIAGLGYVWFAKSGRRYRALGWMYLVLFLLFLINRGRGYYLAAAYPMLFAAGSVAYERWVVSLRMPWSRIVRVSAYVLLAAGGVVSAAIILPLQPANSQKNIALRINGDLREEFGWPELTATVAHIRDNLPLDERAHVGIVVGNYGEAGAINLYGPAYGLPPVLSGTNTAWYRGYGSAPPQTLIVVGFSQKEAEAAFQSCRLAARNVIPYGIQNEEGEYHREIFVCGPPRQPWPAFWAEFRRFG